MDMLAAVGWTTSVSDPSSYALLFLFIVSITRRVYIWTMRRLLTDDVDKRDGNEAAEKRLASTFAHLLNFVLATIALGFQLSASSALAVPKPDISLQDVQYLNVCAKLVLIAYVAELLCTEVHSHIVLHHFLTFMLIFFAELTITHSQQVQWIPFFGWLIFQATAEQFVYVAMFCNHLSAYLRLQNRASLWRDRLLRVSAQLCRFNTFYSYGQKLVPLAFAFYWLSRLFLEDIHAGGISAFTAVWAVLSLSAISILDLWFLESNWSITHHICEKAGLAFPACSPWTALLSRILTRRLRQHKTLESCASSVVGKETVETIV